MNFNLLNEVQKAGEFSLSPPSSFTIKRTVISSHVCCCLIYMHIICTSIVLDIAYPMKSNNIEIKNGLSQNLSIKPEVRCRSYASLIEVFPQLNQIHGENKQQQQPNCHKLSNPLCFNVNAA